MKVRLSDFTRAGGIALNTGECDLIGGVLDPAAGFAYYRTGCSFNGVIKVAISQNGHIKGTRTMMPEWGAITDAAFYSHAAQGNVRLSIYEDAAPRSLLWQSGSLANAAAGSWISVPNFVAGSPGDGIIAELPYGAAPGQLDSLTPTATDETWSMYLTYDNTNGIGGWHSYE